jgi:CheY-like chemotaxis protein/class 3 adenylate cyclase
MTPEQGGSERAGGVPPESPEQASGAAPGQASGAAPGQEARVWSAFRAHLRHELRTPLNAIIGYSEMLLEDAGSLDEPRAAELLSDLGNIHAAGMRMLLLINDLLDPAASPMDGPGLSPERITPQIRYELRTPLNHIIGYCEMLLEDAASAGLETFVPELQKIRSAADKLLGLLEEIVHFAELENLPEGCRPGDATITMMVRDVLRTVRPLEEEPSGRREAPGSILIVEDNEMNRDVLARRLERQGHTITTAEDGRRGLELLREREFDLVLLDLMMPGMNGYQVLQYVKADRALQSIPVIMISALDELESVVRCIEAGAEDYLTKPFDPVLLQARIDACLEKKRLRDREVMYLRQIEQEKQRSEELLHVILPPEIVHELRTTNKVRPRLYEGVAVLFCDVVGFTPYCEQRDPEEVFHILQRLVEVYEELALGHSLEKIKTIGDSFMATAGLLKQLEDPVLAAVECGLQMLARTRELEPLWEVRVGIHIGPVMAGVVGHRQYLFDLWGDTVNTAARIEAHGLAGAVNVSPAVWERLADRCHGDSLGLVSVKGKGPMEIFRVIEVRERLNGRAR